MQVEQHDIESLLAYRPRTDYRISERWLLAPISNYLIWGILPWTFVIGLFLQLPPDVLGAVRIGLIILGLLASALSAQLVYLLVNRRNNHFAREQATFRNLLDILGPKVPVNDENGQWRLMNNYRCYKWLSEYCGEKSAILQALLTLIPYAGWVILMSELLLLTDDWKEHEIREDYMIQEVNGTLGFLGLYLLPNRLRPSILRFRSSVLFLLLSIFTLGLGTLVWLYLSIRDPYEHFEYHSHFEFPLAGLLGPPKAPTGVVA